MTGEASLRETGADVTLTLKTTIDGYDVTVLRYWLRTDHLANPETRPGSSSFALVITEYVIDVGDGNYAVVAFSDNPKGSSSLSRPLQALRGEGRSTTE